MIRMTKQEAQEEKRRQARRAYYREWRRKNPDRAKAIQDRFFDRLAARMNSDAAARR